MSCLNCLRPELSQIWDGFEFRIFTYKLIGYLIGSNMKSEVHFCFVDTPHIVWRFYLVSLMWLHLIMSYHTRSGWEFPICVVIGIQKVSDFRFLDQYACYMFKNVVTFLSCVIALDPLASCHQLQWNWVLLNSYQHRLFSYFKTMKLSTSIVNTSKDLEVKPKPSFVWGSDAWEEVYHYDCRTVGVVGWCKELFTCCWCMGGVLGM